MVVVVMTAEKVEGTGMGRRGGGEMCDRATIALLCCGLRGIFHSLGNCPC